MGFKENLAVILVLIIVQNSNEFRFMRRIQAIGSPYYMILMSLGACKGMVIMNTFWLILINKLGGVLVGNL